MIQGYIESRHGGTVQPTGDPKGNYMLRVTPAGDVAPSQLAQETDTQGIEYLGNDIIFTGVAPTRGFLSALGDDVQVKYQL